MAIGEVDQLSATKRALLERQLRGELLRAHIQLQNIHRRLACDDPAPASYGQRQLWFLTRLAAGSVVYNEAATIHCPPDIHVLSLERAFNEVLRRHEAWRTRLEWRGDDVVQIVTPPREHRLQLVDLAELDSAGRRAMAERLATQDARRPFDEEHEPLWRASVMCLGEEGYRLQLTLRHQIFDAYAVYRILLPELIALHDAFRLGRPSPLPELPLQYGDYAAWQRRWAEGDEAGRQLEYWRSHLRELPQLRMPTDHPRPAVPSFRGRFLPFALDQELTHRLRQVGRSQGATLFMTTLTGFLGLLHCITGQDDLAVGTVSSGRRRPEVEGLLGYFPNPLVLRGDLAGDPSVRELLSRVRDMVLSALANDEVPFEHVVRELGPRRNDGANPLFQVLFTLEPPLPQPPEGWNLTLMDVETGTSKFDLDVELDERPQGLVGRFIYSTDLFDLQTIQRMAGDYRSVLEAMVADPDRRLSSLRQLLSDGADSRSVTTPGWGACHGPSIETAGVGISRRFEEMAQRFARKEALRFGDQRLSYAELDRRANRLAHHLRRLGVERESMVGVCLDRSVEMVTALLAVLKAGGAYVPLDPTYPAASLALLAEQTGLRLAVTTAAYAGRLPPGVDPVVVDARVDVGCPETVLEAAPAPDDLAYVLFTSGSTGTPKGVMVEQRSVLRLVCPATYVDLSRDEVLLHYAPLAFDASTFEIWGALLNGGRLVVAPPGMLSARELGEVVADGGVTTLWLTARLFDQVVEAGMPGLEGVRQLLTGGEALSPAHCRRAHELLPTATLVNGYGPTEATTFACCHQITPSDLESGTLPIGQPIGNTSVYLLDDLGEPVAPGTAGELYIGGAGVARGYLGQPELTRERFLPDRFGGPPGRLYRTGDLARQRSDGDIVFSGRRDRQVKIRGFRVEPSEVEAALASHPAIGETVVEAQEFGGRGLGLVAYFVPRGSPPAPADLDRFLAERLPAPMLPTAYLSLDRLALKPNGKLDRDALPLFGATPAAAESGSRSGTRLPSATESRLASLWAEILHLDTVGPDEDFFALGGHSLLAVRMIAEVERRFGCALPIAVVFAEGSTVSGLANLIERAAQAATPPSSALMVPIKTVGRRPPVFVVEPNPEAVLSLRHFLPFLDAEQPLIALIVPNQNGRFDRCASIETLADELLRLIRSRQPEGPYRLGGYSFGGLLAYHLAARLSEAGERVDFCGLIDSLSPELIARHCESSMSMRTRLRRLRLSPLSEWPGMLSGACRRTIVGLAGGTVSLEPNEFDAEGAAELAGKYQVRKCNVPLTVLSSRWQQRWTRDSSLGWRSTHAGPLRVQSVLGDHRTILVQPNVNDLAARFAHQIPEAEQESLGLGLRHSTLPAAGPRVSVVMPARNESANLWFVLPRLPDRLHEVILVDGHSNDETIQIARQLRPDIRILSQPGRGKGDALRCGFLAATGDVVVAIDADGSTDPGEIPLYVGGLMAGADFVKGSRYLQGGGSADLSLFRSFGNVVLTNLVRVLFGNQFSDLCYGYTALWRWTLPVLHLDADGFEIETQMSVRALRSGLTVTEVPSYEHPRVSGASNLRAVSDGWRVLRTVLGERLGRWPGTTLEMWLADRLAEADHPRQ